MGTTDTIVAVATGMSESGIAVVRLSGPDAVAVANMGFHGADLSSAPTHTVHYGFFSDKERTIDEVLTTVFRAPRSYTKEDTVEISCHGSPLIARQITEALISYGARLAEPGEFTKRAFLNGRIDLTEAESVMELISAKSELARKNSLRQLRGSLYEKVVGLRKRLLHRLAFLEAALDDPEHYELGGFSAELKTELEQISTEIKDLLSTAENGRFLTEGILTVIVGKPNVGKSSLLNLLLGEERAIVTEIAGTTRDTLEEVMQLRGVPLRIMDTAGIRETEDTVEKIGVKRARDAVRDADLALLVIDASVPLSAEDREIASLLSGKQTIVLLNKTDLTPIVTEELLRETLISDEVPILPFSSKEGIGLERLEKTIEKVFFSKNVSMNDEIILTNVRQKEALIEADRSLSLVLQSMKDQMPEDLYAVDLMDAYTSLGQLIGEEVGEDLLNEIFSKFCMGK